MEAAGSWWGVWVVVTWVGEGGKGVSSSRNMKIQGPAESGKKQ